MHNLSQNPSNDSYTKGSVRTSGNNMNLDIDDLIHIRVKNPSNPIIGFLNIRLFRNKIDILRKVC